MAKVVVTKIKLQCPAGQATPAPPIGPALGQHGVPIKQFVDRFNAATKDKAGLIIPVVISVYKDKSFDFITKSPPAAVLLKKAAGIAKGAETTGRELVGAVTHAQLAEIAALKQEDLGAASIEAGARMIAGTARSMGLEVKD